MARYRLRFLLQEFDLPRGSTVVGRSLDCNLTIEDPLVSRQHARIVVDDTGATVEDLGSRNGVRVNGVQVHGPTALKDGDRVRLGTQDFVFCRVEVSGRAHSRTTGVLRLCAKCRLPYPREMVACPNCEATEQTEEEETLSGTLSPDSQNAWNVQLFVEALERALKLGRVSDAERLARRATGQVEELMVATGTIDAKALAALASQAVATTLASNDPTWLLWAIDVYRRTTRIPPLDVADRIGEAASKHAGVAKGALGSLLEHLGGASGKSAEEAEAVARLDRTRGALESQAGAGGPPPSPDETTGEWSPRS